MLAICALMRQPLYEHTEYNGVVLDFTFIIEEVTI